MWVKLCKDSARADFGNKNNGGMKANLIMNSEQLWSGIMAEKFKSDEDRTRYLCFNQTSNTVLNVRRLMLVASKKPYMKHEHLWQLT